MRRPFRQNAGRCVVVSLELLPLEGGQPALVAQLEHAYSVIGVQPAKGLFHKPGSRVYVTDRRVLRIVTIQANATSLFSELFEVAHLQAQLCAHDVLVRGAVTVGEVEARGQFAIGAGVSDAERLREMAEVPRVVVDPRALAAVEDDSDLRSTQHGVAQEFTYLNRMVQQDSDGVWFVNYLAAYVISGLDPTPLLFDHRNIVERGLDSTAGLDRDARRWTWLWAYHNQTVDALRAQGRLDDDVHRAFRTPVTSPLLYAFPTVPKP